MRALEKGLCVAISLAAQFAIADTVWTPLPEDVSVSSLFSGRTVLMYKKQLQYYRSDGVMVDYDRTTDWYTVRGWRIDERGRMCWLIVNRPDHVIDCAEVQVSKQESGMFRYKWDTAQGGSPFEYAREPTEAMLAKLEEVVGRAQ